MHTIAVIKSVKNSVIDFMSVSATGSRSVNVCASWAANDVTMKEILKPTPGERDDADDDADRRRSCAHADGIFRTDHEGVDEIEHDGLAGIALDEGVDQERQHEAKKRSDEDQLCEHARRDGRNDGCQESERDGRHARGAYHQAGRDAPESSEIRCEAGKQHDQQHGERHDRLPSFTDDFCCVGQLLGRQSFQPGALGLEMDLHEHAKEVHARRHDRRQDYGLIRQV
jgi:hypothetical protein